MRLQGPHSGSFQERLSAQDNSHFVRPGICSITNLLGNAYKVVNPDTFMRLLERNCPISRSDVR
jgi:hypothetical protein